MHRNRTAVSTAKPTFNLYLHTPRPVPSNMRKTKPHHRSPSQTPTSTNTCDASRPSQGSSSPQTKEKFPNLEANTTKHTDGPNYGANSKERGRDNASRGRDRHLLTPLQSGSHQVEDLDVEYYLLSPSAASSAAAASLGAIFALKRHELGALLLLLRVRVRHRQDQPAFIKMNGILRQVATVA